MSFFLQTERLYLRPFELKDASRVQWLADDKAVADTTVLPHPYTMEDAVNWIETHNELINNRKAFPFAVVLRSKEEIIGSMTLRLDDDHYLGELAYWVGRDYWNRGYATEAARCILDFGFRDQQFNRIWASTFSRNKASGKVMQKLGMDYEGTLRQHRLKDHQYEDIDLFGLLKKDYDQL